MLNLIIMNISFNINFNLNLNLINLKQGRQLF